MEITSISHHLLTQYGLATTDVVRIVEGVMNENYRCVAEGQMYICKVYRYKTQQDIIPEIDILHDLSTRGFPCPRILSTLSNETVSLLEGKSCVLYPALSGEPMKEITEAILYKVGGLIATLHTSARPAPALINKPSWDPEDIQYFLRESGDTVASYPFSIAKEIISFLRQEIPFYTFPDTLPKGVTHQDIKPENILISEGLITGIIDFDNCYYGTLLHDITTTIIWTCIELHHFSEKKIQALLSGYEEVRSLTADEKEYLNKAILWRLLREIFIGPYVTKDNLDIAFGRSQYFMNIYHKAKSTLNISI